PRNAPIKPIATTEDLMPPNTGDETPSLDELLQEVDEGEVPGGASNASDAREQKPRSSGIFRRIFGKK
ncbi:MAG: hypothetical protein KAI47_04550, partial [Deltaproteobacteria bacterium]|nr:hypothetical protein [Deltaproteobacteria bacterium]